MERSPTIILTADETMMSKYRGGMFLGFSTCSPRGIMPDWMYFAAFAPPVAAAPPVATAPPTVALPPTELAPPVHAVVPAPAALFVSQVLSGLPLQPMAATVTNQPKPNRTPDV